jgi:hypothetical protein
VTVMASVAKMPDMPGTSARLGGAARRQGGAEARWPRGWPGARRGGGPWTEHSVLPVPCMREKVPRPAQWPVPHDGCRGNLRPGRWGPVLVVVLEHPAHRQPGAHVGRVLTGHRCDQQRAGQDRRHQERPGRHADRARRPAPVEKPADPPEPRRPHLHRVSVLLRV